MSSAKWRPFCFGLNELPSSLWYKTHQIPTYKRFSYCLAAVFSESLEARCQVENEDVVGAAPTGDAPTTSEWSTILLPTKVRLILEVLWHTHIYAPITVVTTCERHRPSGNNEQDIRKWHFVMTLLKWITVIVRKHTAIWTFVGQNITQDWFQMYTWRGHGIQSVSALMALGEGNPPLTGTVTQALIFSFW